MGTFKQLATNQRFIGLSTETKPTAGVNYGAEWYQVNSGTNQIDKVYTYVPDDGTGSAGWVETAGMNFDATLQLAGADVSASNPVPISPLLGNTVLRAAISASTSGDNTLVAAVAGKKTKVLGLVLIASGDVDVRLESGAGGTALTGVISLAADGNGFVLPMALPGMHWLETGVNTLLNLELSAAVQVSGLIVYEQSA